MFKTYSIGSLPRPQWIKDLIENRKSRHITSDECDALLDTAIPSAIKLQEYAGLDFVSDGEWRRESYVKVFSDAVSGFKSDLHIEESSVPVSKLAYPAVVDRIKFQTPIATKEALFLKQFATRNTTVAIPSAYTIGRRMWSAEHSQNAYPTREEFIHDCVPILRDEIGRLEKAGIDSIQLDDPWLALLVDGSYRKKENIVNIDHEIELSINSINFKPSKSTCSTLSLSCKLYDFKESNTRFNLSITACCAIASSRNCLLASKSSSELIVIARCCIAN